MLHSICTTFGFPKHAQICSIIYTKLHARVYMFVRQFNCHHASAPGYIIYVVVFCVPVSSASSWTTPRIIIVEAWWSQTSNSLTHDTHLWRKINQSIFFYINELCMYNVNRLCNRTLISVYRLYRLKFNEQGRVIEESHSVQEC